MPDVRRPRPADALRIGRAIGRIVFGAVGDASQLEYTVIGAAVLAIYIIWECCTRACGIRW